MIPANERKKQKPHFSTDVFSPNISMPQTKHIDAGVRFCVVLKAYPERKQMLNDVPL